VGGPDYIQCSMSIFLLTYRLHGIFGIEKFGSDERYGLHDKALGLAGDRTNFPKRKARVNAVYNYAKAASKHTCKSEYALLFVRSKDNPTLELSDPKYHEWKLNVDEAATRVVREVIKQISADRKSLGLKSASTWYQDNMRNLGLFKMTTAINAIEGIAKKRKK
jgi:uncharacterized Ntn-hydrolase superfamily protein